MGSRNQTMISFAHDLHHHFPMNNNGQHHKLAEDSTNKNSPIDPGASFLMERFPSSMSPWISENQLMNSLPSSSSSLSANLRYMESANTATVMAPASCNKLVLQALADQGTRFSHDYTASVNCTDYTWLRSAAAAGIESSHEEDGRPAARVNNYENYLADSHHLLNTTATTDMMFVQLQGSHQSEGKFATSTHAVVENMNVPGQRRSSSALAATKAQTSGVVLLSSPPSRDHILDFLLPDTDGIPGRDYHPVLSAGVSHNTADTTTSGKETSSSAAAAEENQLKIAADLLDFECCRQSKDMGDDECGEVSQPQRRPSKRSRVPENHNLSEKRRRNRINEKLRNLQKLIPNSTKTDKASILDEVIEYLKTLRLQLQMISSRRGMLTVSPAGIISVNGAAELPTDVKSSNINDVRQCPTPPSSSSMLQHKKNHYPPPSDVSGFRSSSLMAAAAADPNYQPGPISASSLQPNRDEGDQNNEPSAGLAHAFSLDATFIANSVIQAPLPHSQHQNSMNAACASYPNYMLPLSQNSSPHFAADIEAHIHGAAADDDFQYLYRHLHHELGDGFHRDEYRDIHEEAAHS